MKALVKVPMNLRLKISLAIIIAAALPLLLLVSFPVVKFSQSRFENTLHTLDLLLSKEAQGLSAFFAERKAEVSALAEMPAMTSMDFLTVRPHLLAEIERLNPAYEKFILGRPSGHFHNTVGGNPHQNYIRTFNDTQAGAEPRSIEDRDYWRATVGNNQMNEKITYVSEPMISYTNGVKQIVVASSIHNAAGEVVGMLGGSLPWHSLEKKIAAIRARVEAKLGVSAKLFLLSPSGYYWYHWEPEKIVHLQVSPSGEHLLDANGEKVMVRPSIRDEVNLTLVSQADAMFGGKGGYIELEASADNNGRFLLYQPVDSSGYVLGLYLPKTFISESVAEVQIMMLGLGLFVLVLLVFVSSGLGYTIGKPIKALSDIAQRIADGQTVPRFEVKSQDETGQLTRKVFLMLDTLEAREQELKKSEERLLLAMRGADDGVWDWDVKTGEVYYSPRWKSMLGFDENELEGHITAWQSLIHPSDFAAATRATKDCFEGITTQYEIEFRMRHKEGHYVDILSRAILLRDSEEKPARLVGTHVDITERKQQQERISRQNIELEEHVAERTAELEERNIQLQIATIEAQRASELKSNFLANMSHELRTPLNAIIGFAKRGQRYLADSKFDRLAESLDTVERSGNHLLGLINQILDLSKIESGHLELSKEMIDVNELMEECIRALKPLAERKHLEIGFDESRQCQYEGDRLRLKQVLINLISNAIKFTEVGSIKCSVGIHHENLRRWLCISVSDTGTGIPKDQLENIFNKFTQMGSTENRAIGEGSGLGLSITKEIVELHNGKVEVESESGKGSCFTLHFPIS